MDIILSLINHMAVLMVIAYVLTRTRFYIDIIYKKFSFKNRLLLILIFGVFSIYGTLSGIRIYDAISNIRDLGPALGGLIAGPIIGVGAGLIGATHRYLLGGSTAFPCSIATVFAGLAGGIVYKIKKGKLIRIPEAIIFAIFIELFHIGLVLSIGRPFHLMCEISKKISLSLISVNTVGLVFFIYITSNLIKEKETAAIKERIESELHIAREIQMDLIPKIFPPFPSRAEFDIYAVLEPAKEVGGDLYDFFFLNDDLLCFLVGDVSGKGVPASLFMAIAKTLIKTAANKLYDPSEILTKVNTDLCRDNDSAMFITIFCGILNTQTGEVLYANGGHNPPLLLRKNNTVEWIEKTGDIVVGALEGIKYKMKRFFLLPGDSLCIYTDGVTEAMDENGDLFSDERLKDTLGGLYDPSPEEAINAILDWIRDFSIGMPQSDDITILFLRFFGKN